MILSFWLLIILIDGAQAVIVEKHYDSWEDCNATAESMLLTMQPDLQLTTHTLTHYCAFIQKGAR